MAARRKIGLILAAGRLFERGFRFWPQAVGVGLADDLSRSGSKACECGMSDVPRRMVSGPLRAPSLPS
jgi:hypothetical protein